MNSPLITIETPKDSTILAYETMSDPRRRGLLSLSVGSAIVFFILSLLWIGFRSPLPVRTITLAIVVRPVTVAHILDQETQTYLPLSWQQALNGSSWWPVILGGGLQKNEWRWFAIMPRWRLTKELPSTGAGLARIIYDYSPDQHASDSAFVRYSEALQRSLRSPFDQARGWIDMGHVSTSSSVIDFTFRDDILRTSLSFEHELPSFQPRAADVSLEISSLTGALREEVMNGLPVPSFARLPSLKEAHFVFGEGGFSAITQLVHQEPLSREAIRSVLAGFGIAAKRTIRLEDGTSATELVTMDEPMTEPARIDHRQELLVRDHEIRYGSSTESLPFVPNACGNHPVMGRVSAKAISLVLQGTSVTIHPSEMRGWQFGRDEDGSMILCRE